jgi:hypothetical protein
MRFRKLSILIAGSGCLLLAPVLAGCQGGNTKPSANYYEGPMVPKGKAGPGPGATTPGPGGPAPTGNPMGEKVPGT